MRAHLRDRDCGTVPAGFFRDDIRHPKGTRPVRLEQPCAMVLVVLMIPVTWPLRDICPSSCQQASHVAAWATTYSEQCIILGPRSIRRHQSKDDEPNFARLRNGRHHVVCGIGVQGVPRGQQRAEAILEVVPEDSRVHFFAPRQTEPAALQLCVKGICVKLRKIASTLCYFMQEDSISKRTCSLHQSTCT